MNRIHTPGSIQPGKLPGAWYDLAVRISEAQAVASCALEAVPCGTGEAYERGNVCGNLIAAVQDLLHLMEADARMVEQHMSA